MGDVVNAANSQSAIQATIGSVTDAAVDPWSYSLSRFVPPHSKTWSRLQPTNPQQAQAGGSLFFDIPKLGWVTSCTLSMQLNWAAEDANGSLQTDYFLCTPGTGWLNAVESIVVQSSSRELYRITRAGLIAAYSDMDAGILQAIERGLDAKCDGRFGQAYGQPSDAAQGKKTIIIPIPLACNQSNGLNIPALFSEPVRYVINFKPKWDFYFQAGSGNGASTFGGGVFAGSNAYPGYSVDVSITDCELIMQQVSLPSELTASTLSQNYSAGSLSQLSYDYVEESVMNDATLAAANTMPTERLSHVITSTASIEDIYVFAEVEPDQWDNAGDASNSGNADWFGAVGTNVSVPLPLRDFRLEASGQVLADCPTEFLSICGRPTQSAGFYQAAGQGGNNAKFARTVDMLAGPSPNTSGSAMNTCYVYRLCLSESASKLYSGNQWNLRELSNVTVSCGLPVVSSTNNGECTTHANDFVPGWMAGKKIKMRVILRKAGLISTNSANGRTVAVLSN